MRRTQPHFEQELFPKAMLETSKSSEKGVVLPIYPEEAKRRLDTKNLLELILSRDNMLKSLDKVKKNKGSSGIDGMSTAELPTYLKENWLTIKAKIETGKYKPSSVRKVEIPKDDCSKRMLGIPTVTDRLIQQAISQVLIELYDGGFSENSFGFRPGRNAHQAIERAKSYIESGCEYVVDLDIEKFFDRVNHDYLMSRLSEIILDKRLLLLIRRYLQSGIMDNGMTTYRAEGMAQGSPLSPILSNILLDELDKELLQRGHKFVRYADDCTIYTRSSRAGERIMESIKRFIEKRLKLKLNESKSGVRRPDEINLLGYSFYLNKKGKWLIRISNKSKKKLKEKMAIITNRHRAGSIETIINELAPKLRGWGNYFKLTEFADDLRSIDRWVRTRLRMLIWTRWKRIRTKIRELRKLGISERNSIRWAMSRKGCCRVANSPILKQSLTNSYFLSIGYFELSSLVPKRN